MNDDKVDQLTLHGNLLDLLIVYCLILYFDNQMSLQVIQQCVN